MVLQNPLHVLGDEPITGQQFLVLFFFILIFRGFLNVFWCAESENDVSFFVV